MNYDEACNYHTMTTKPIFIHGLPTLSHVAQRAVLILEPAACQHVLDVGLDGVRSLRLPIYGLKACHVRRSSIMTDRSDAYR
jgi:hypothetical protein